MEVRQNANFIEIIEKRFYKKKLLSSIGPYAAEKLTDFSYSIVAYGVFIFYHFGFLEFFAVVSKNKRSINNKSPHLASCSAFSLSLHGVARFIDFLFIHHSLRDD